MTNDQLLGVADLAARWGKTEAAIRKARARRQPLPPAIKIGNSVLWRLSDVEAFETAHYETALPWTTSSRRRRSA